MVSECPICGRAYTYEEHCVAHILRQHSDTGGTIKCCCGYEASNIGRLRAHVGKQHGFSGEREATYGCQRTTCGATLGNEAQLRQHYAEVHQLEQPLVDALVEDTNIVQRVVDDERRCEYCERGGFRSLRTYARHVLNAHPSRHFKLTNAGSASTVEPESHEIRISGAQQPERAQRRTAIEEIIGQVREHIAATAQAAGIVLNENQATIEALDRAHPFPELNWTEQDQIVEYGNVSVELVEVTRRGARTALVHTITRRFVVRFINELRRDDLSPSSRLALFQEATVIAFCLILLNRKLVARPELCHTQVIMNDTFRTMIGVPCLETVADLVSYFAQASQSDRADDELAAEAPLTTQQMAQSSISNMIERQEMTVTLHSTYYMPRTEQEDRQVREAVQQVVTRDSRRAEQAARMTDASRPDAPIDVQNRRIRRELNRQRKEERARKERMQHIYGAPLPLQPRRRQQPPPPIIYDAVSSGDEEEDPTQPGPSVPRKRARRMRAYNKSRLAAEYARLYPGALYDDYDATKGAWKHGKCLLVSIAYAVLAYSSVHSDFGDELILQRWAKPKKKRRLNGLFGSAALRLYVKYMEWSWYEAYGSGAEPPREVPTHFEALLAACDDLQRFTFHIAYVCLARALQ